MGRYKGDILVKMISWIIMVVIRNMLRSINKASKNDIEGEREQALVDQWVRFLSWIDHLHEHIDQWVVL